MLDVVLPRPAIPRTIRVKECAVAVTGTPVPLPMHTTISPSHRRLAGHLAKLPLPLILIATWPNLAALSMLPTILPTAEIVTLPTDIIRNASGAMSLALHPLALV